MVSDEQDGVIRVPPEGAVFAGVSPVVHVIGSLMRGQMRRTGGQIICGAGDSGGSDGPDEGVGSGSDGSGSGRNNNRGAQILASGGLRQRPEELRYVLSGLNGEFLFGGPAEPDDGQRLLRGRAHELDVLQRDHQVPGGGAGHAHEGEQGDELKSGPELEPTKSRDGHGGYPYREL